MGHRTVKKRTQFQDSEQMLVGIAGKEVKYTKNQTVQRI